MLDGPPRTLLMTAAARSLVTKSDSSTTIGGRNQWRRSRWARRILSSGVRAGLLMGVRPLPSRAGGTTRESQPGEANYWLSSMSSLPSFMYSPSLVSE